MRRAGIAMAVSVLCAAAASYTWGAELTQLPAVKMPQVQTGTLNYGLQATDLGQGWHVVAGAVEDFAVANGCNIINTGFYVGTQGVWVLNTGPSRLYGQQQRALIEQVAPGKLVQGVLALNLHPDYFLGNQGFDSATLMATADTLAGMRRESKAYEDNLFKLCGDWMRGTESVLPTQVTKPNALTTLDDRPVQLLELQGHTDSDLVVFDPQNRLLWAGGLVFYNRIVTTPHARIKPWIASLQRLKSLNPAVVVPSHGPVHTGTQGIDQTLDYLQWLDGHLQQAAAEGLTALEVMQQGAPQRFRGFAAYPVEFNRNITSLYPAYERAALTGAPVTQ